MLTEIITRTPIWVFVLFFFLVFLGLSQVKDRRISFPRVMILPIVMLFLSIAGVISAFGLSLVSIFTYLFSLSLGIIFNIMLKLPRNSEFLEEEKQFFIKGSFIPLFLIMCIFFTKYFVGVVTAKELDFIFSIYFISTISFLYGFFSGIFIGRVFILKKMLI